jgi:hypothetical protein
MSSTPALGSFQPPIHWVPGALFPGIKRPGREADHSPPTSAEVKKMWVYTSTPPYAFMASAYVVQGQLYLLPLYLCRHVTFLVPNFLSTLLGLSPNASPSPRPSVTFYNTEFINMSWLLSVRDYLRNISAAILRMWRRQPEERYAAVTLGDNNLNDDLIIRCSVMR